MTPAAEAFVKLGFEAQAPMRLLGAKLGAISSGTVSIEVPITETLTTYGTGVVLGGILAAIGDVAAGLSLISAMAEPRPVTTIDFTSHQISPAKGDRVVAIGKVEHLGKSVGIASAEVFAERGSERRLCCRLTATFRVIE
jgi:uncharacterized protein (TIGR00369 family)